MECELIISAAREEEALAARRQVLANLSEKMAEVEMTLADTRSTLLRFQRRYYQVMARRYVELDEIRARIARKRAEDRPEDEDFLREAWSRRHCADRSADEFREYLNGQEAEDTASQERLDPGEEAKKLYRTIAVEIHPDRAEAEGTRKARTALMAELNAAYASGDMERMQAILNEWRNSPEAVPGNGPRAELQRLERTIERMERRIARIEREIARLCSSDMGRLQGAARQATAAGRDLLAEMAADLDRRIDLARFELDELS